MQMFYSIADAQTKQEMEQKRQTEQIQKIEQTVTNMKKELIEPIVDWRSEINAKVREIAMKSGIDYQSLFTQMYGEVEQTAHCSLKRLCENKRDRMEKAGNTKTCIKNEATRIAIIEGKPQLKAIFESIVRRSDGSLTVGMTDLPTQTVYLSENLYGAFLRKVFCREVCHTAMFSYGINMKIE